MKTWLGAARVYLDRRVVRILVLGFASGLPFPLVYSTLSAWLQEVGVTKTAIGLFSLVGTAYSFKMLWSPLVDRMPLPLLTRAFGQRRGWFLFSQVGVAAAMLGLGDSSPASDLWACALWAVVLAFASATQDIVADAYRIESLEQDQFGAGAGIFVLGYRVAMVAGGAGALILAELAGWFAAYAAMAGLMGAGVLVVLLSPEPVRPRADAETVPLGVRLVDSVIGPLADFFRRPHALAILLFVGLYKYGDALLGVMANPFYLEMGFSKIEIGEVSKVFGMAMTIAGGLLGGVLVARLGILRMLLWGGIAQALSNLVFAVQAMVGHSLPMLAVTIGIEGLTTGIGTTAFVAYLSSLCSVAYTATQYALLSSLMAFARTILASGGGWLAERLDWVSYFVVTTAAAVPGLLLLAWLMRTPSYRPFSTR